MDQATQQNAAMAEQATAAARSMKQETGKLAEMVGQFQLGGATNSDAIRRELKKAAPHAFAPPSEGHASKPQHPRPKPKIAVNSRAGGRDADSWKGF